jgi:hypothetical protein
VDGKTNLQALRSASTKRQLDKNLDAAFVSLASPAPVRQGWPDI